MCACVVFDCFSFSLNTKFQCYCSGAHPTQTALCGRTAIGIACLNKHAEVLELLLNACVNYEPSNYDYDTGESEAKKWKGQERDDEQVLEV